MAVTAAPTRKANPVAWMSSREKLRAGLGRHGNFLIRRESCSFDRYDKLVTTNHVQTGTCREFDGSWICL
jgi:hypothetical protein